MSNPLSPKQLKKEFAFLNTELHYLDNASTSQRPKPVIEAITDYYTNYNANVHRGIYELSERASTAYEETRAIVQQFIGAEHAEEIIFTSGATHSLNLAARLLAQELKTGDEIIVSVIEHHANLVPWQLVAKERGLKLVTLTPNAQDELEPAELEKLITDRTKILAIAHISNVTGYIAPVKALAAVAHEHEITVVVDGAQSAPHIAIDVQELGIDLLAFSGHKLCGPTGTGVLYGKREILERLEPIFGGGSMIDQVTPLESTWAPLPDKLEPGTPNVAGVIGLGAAINYLQSIGMENIHQRIEELYTYMWERFEAAEGVTSYGPKNREVRTGIISFTASGLHPHDIASILDQNNIAVRAGHHCAQPLMKHWGVPSTTRASLYFYNTKKDIDALMSAIIKAQEILAN